MSAAAVLTVRGLSKSFGGVRAVDGVSLAVNHGEFFTLLGASGSGKTTLLRLIAGFERPDAGQVLVGGHDVTKNPAYRDVLYVEELIGPETVNTMPKETIEAFQDHGRVAETLETGLEEARSLFGELEAVGVDLEGVWLTLEQEGVQKFADSFTELLDGIRAKRGELVEAA